MKTQNIFLSILMIVGVVAIIYYVLKNSIWKEKQTTTVSGEVSSESKIQGTKVEVQKTQAEVQGTQVNQTEIQITQTNNTEAEAEATGAEAGAAGAEAGAETEAEAVGAAGAAGAAEAEATGAAEAEAGTEAEAEAGAEAAGAEAGAEAESEEEQVPELGIPLRGPNAMVITSSSSNTLQGKNTNASIRLRSQNTITNVGTVDPKTGYRVYTEPIVLKSLTSSPGGSVNFSLGDESLLKKGLQLRVTCDSCN